MALSFGVGDYIEGSVLVVVIILNVGIGFYQEYQAEAKMDSLRNLSSPSARVLRDGREEVVPRYVHNFFISIKSDTNICTAPWLFLVIFVF